MDKSRSTKFEDIKIGANSDTLFFCAFLLGLIADFIPMTMFVEIVPSSLLLLLKGLSLIVIILKILLYDKFSFKEIIAYIVIMLILSVNAYLIGDFSLILYFFVAVGARDVNKHIIVKVAFFTLLGLLIVTILSCLANIIPNLIFERKNDNGSIVLRQALGTIYPTVLGSIIFFLFLQFLYIKGKLKFRYAVVSVILAIFVDKITDNRLVFYLLVFMSIIIIIDKKLYLLKNDWPRFFKVLTLFVAILAPITFTYLCMNYDTASLFDHTLNSILSNRLVISWNGFQKYSVKLFGQVVEMNGWGKGKGLPYGVNYFYLDSLPVNLLLIRGGIIFIGYLVYNFSFIKGAFKRKDNLLVIILIFILIYDLVDDKSLRLFSNPFLLLFLQLNFSKEHKMREFTGDYLR